MTIIPNNESNSNDLAQKSSNLLLQGSVLWIPSSRQEWDDCVSEMKAVCTSAAFRRWSKGVINDYERSVSNIHYSSNNNDGHTTNTSSSSPHSSTTMKSFQPPLSQAFIKDRVQIDDPLRGYQIRHAKGGWLQGFLVWTSFTVWTQDFQWDSNHPSSGLLHQDIKSDGRSFAEDDGTLSRELQALPRGEQDPLDGGIVMKQVAEISLLGGLGCGELLLCKAIEDIRKSKSNDGCNYKYVVLQATEGSRSFYEKMGFVRVGAVCRYRWAEYCSNKSSSTTALSGKKPNLKKLLATEVARKSSIDPPPTFYGYRHWTYTNESYKSLDAHGGPSVMMCLKLEDNNEQHVHQDTVSELLQPHVVREKPVIQLFGNVSNPESEKVTPTRKSQRRSSINRGTQQQQQEEREIGNVSQHPPLVGAPQSEGLTAANAIMRRTSNRSKRGRNTSLADSGYVLYGVEGGRNSSNEKTSNATNATTFAKRQRRTSKPKHNVIRESMKTTKEIINDAVVFPSSSSESDLDNSTSHNGKSSTIIKLKGLSAIGQTSSLASTTNPSLSLKDSVENNIIEKASTTETSPGCDANSDKITTIFIEKNIENTNGNASPLTSNESSLKSLAAPSTSNISTKYTEERKSENPPGRITTTQKAYTEKADSASEVDGSSFEEERVASEKQCVERAAESQGRVENNQQQLTLNAAGPTRTPFKGGPNIVRKNEEQIENSNVCRPRIDPILSKDGRKTAIGNIHNSIEVKTNKSPSSSVTRDAVHQVGTRNGRRTTSIPRKRSRRPVMKVNSSKLFKQKLSENSKTTDSFYNQIVIRRDVQNVLDNRLNKRRRVDDDPKKGCIRWRYNGGLMMDHRYEFCYYFVLHFDESKKSLTIVPMLKDGVFERSTGSKKKGIHSTVRDESVLDERLLGRPRYQCNILKTDKNWIRDVPLEEYAIVPEAVAVFDTPLVAQEAWDIGDGVFAPHV
jgi:hypothetical protein